MFSIFKSDVQWLFGNDTHLKVVYFEVFLKVLWGTVMVLTHSHLYDVQHAFVRSN